MTVNILLRNYFTKSPKSLPPEIFAALILCTNKLVKSTNVITIEDFLVHV